MKRENLYSDFPSRVPGSDRMPAGELGRGQAVTACELDLLEDDSAAARRNEQAFVHSRGQTVPAGSRRESAISASMDFQDRRQHPSAADEGVGARARVSSRESRLSISLAGLFQAISPSLRRKLWCVGRERVVLFLRRRAPRPKRSRHFSRAFGASCARRACKLPAVAAGRWRWQLGRGYRRCRGLRPFA